MAARAVPESVSPEIRHVIRLGTREELRERGDRQQKDPQEVRRPKGSRDHSIGEPEHVGHRHRKERDHRDHLKPAASRRTIQRSKALAIGLRPDVDISSPRSLE